MRPSMGMEYLDGVARLEDLSGRHIGQWLSLRLEGSAHEQQLQAPLQAVHHHPGSTTLAAPETTLVLNIRGSDFNITLHPHTPARLLR